MSTVLTKIKFYSKLVLHYKNYIEIIKNIVLKKPLLNLYLRNGIEIHANAESQILTIAEEIFFDQVYLRGKLNIVPGDTVVDIGGNVGIFSLFAVQKGARAVYVYEPFLANVRCIKRNMKRSNVRTVQVFQQAVSDKVARAKLYLGHHNAGHLLFNHNNAGVLKKYISIPTTTLAEIVRQHALPTIDFLKIDCEGSEGAILKSTPTSTWKKVKQVALEYHDNVSSLNHAQIEERLRSLGFSTTCISDGESEFGYVYGWREAN